MLHTVVAASFEDMEEADYVGIDIAVRVLEGVADTGLRGEVHHALRPVFGKQFFYRRPILQVTSCKLEARQAFEPRQPRLLQADIVVVAEVVDADDLVAALEQHTCGM